MGEICGPARGREREREQDGHSVFRTFLSPGEPRSFNSHELDCHTKTSHFFCTSNKFVINPQFRFLLQCENLRVVSRMHFSHIHHPAFWHFNSGWGENYGPRYFSWQFLFWNSDRNSLFDYLQDSTPLFRFNLAQELAMINFSHLFHNLQYRTMHLVVRIREGVIILLANYLFR